MLFSTGSSNVFDPSKDVPDLSGKVFVVTGGSAGLGYGIAAHILEHQPQKLYIISSNQDRLAQAYTNLKSFGDVSGKVEPIQCDFNDLQQTDRVARQLEAELTRLDGLILNAGLGIGPYGLSKNGIETHMQVNVIAQHHLMNVLLPKLVATQDSRLVYQSSELHRFDGGSDVRFADLEEINADVGPLKRYGRSKLALILLARELVRRKNRSERGMKPNQSPWIIACHPGGVATDQQDQAIEAYGSLSKPAVKAVQMLMKDPVEQGCRPVLYAATSEDISNGEFDGAYIVPDKKVSKVSSNASDEELGERCLALVEELIQANLGEKGGVAS